MSFLFNCCKAQTKQGYQLKTLNQNNEEIITFVPSLKEIDNNQIPNYTQILKMEKSEYEQLYKQYKDTDKKWTDPQFPPKNKSIGHIEGLGQEEIEWKRVGDIMLDPKLFKEGVEPKDVVQGSLDNCYFLSAIAALAEKQSRIYSTLSHQIYNPYGIYKVQMRLDGYVREIIVDDFIPVNKYNKPLFCQPNHNEFWVLILEKAWAKVHGSYENINSGTPTQVFKAFTYAPAKMIPIGSNEKQIDSLWEKIIEHSKRNYPCCCGTKIENQLDVDWKQIGLVPGHAYTLIEAANLEDSQYQIHKILKLRNPWGEREWKGQGCESDTQFWDRITQNQEKQKFLVHSETKEDGIFYISYADFCHFFSQTHFCLLQDKAMYQMAPVRSDGKHGSFFVLNVKKQGFYTIQLHQPSLRGQSEKRKEIGLCRSTILLAKSVEYNYQDGILKYNEEDTTLRSYLYPGDYAVYVKFDPTLQQKLVPQNAAISCYSTQFATIKLSQQIDHPNFFRKFFLSYARQNKKKKFDDDKMWLSYKLLYQNGGYAYIAMGNDISSQRNFQLSFNQRDFTQKNFKLKKPYKNKGQQTIEVRPGCQQIIVIRIINSQIKQMKFPPPLDMKIV